MYAVRKPIARGCFTYQPPRYFLDGSEVCQETKAELRVESETQVDAMI